MQKSKNKKDSSNLFQVLHISDLHMATKENFDRSVVLDPLIEKLKEDRDSGIEPEIVIVTGDIAKTGIKGEYEAARLFFNDILDSLGLSDDQLFITPGNHDVNRKQYRPSDVPHYQSMSDLNAELENEAYRADLLQGMTDYFRFIESYYPHLKSKNGRLVPFAMTYTVKCGKRIGLLGLNSAWMCRKSPDEREIAIGEYQVKNALEELNESGEYDLVLGIFHHPLAWLWPEDRRICRRYLNGTVLLCGHLHDAEGEEVHDLQGRIFQFQAGCAYAGSAYPNSFHYIGFDWAHLSITLDYRKFDPYTRKWCVQGEKGKDGKAFFKMFGPEKACEEASDIIDQDEIFGKYLQGALNEHRHLPTQGFETNLRFPIEIERVYINMHATLHGQDCDYMIKRRNEMLERNGKEDISLLGIKGAFEASDRHKIKDMVILGDPGSGKTILLKYILIKIIQGKGKKKFGLPEGLIPFLAPLRKLKNPDKENFLDFIKNACCLEDLEIPREVLKTLLDKGRCIILLDGLDEVANKVERIKACQWIDRARRKFPYTRFIITSRFAGYLEQSRLSGNLLELAIQDFTMEEAEEFLTKWFETVETALRPGGDEERWQKKGREEALILAGRISQSQHLRKLAVNPLLLQIIALVHRDRGTLPQRRVELYEECTNVLLEKWDMAKGLDVLLTAREARKILQPLALWLHEVDERKFAPIEEIREQIKESLEEIQKSHLDPETLLLNVRDRSGIFMGYSEKEFGFTHLSFQEYLAAEEIRNKRDIDRLIGQYGNRWWREVILLCLALDNPSIIEAFMEKIVSTKQFLTEIDLVIHALKDSISKPPKPFIAALTNKDLPLKAKYNAIQALKEIRTEKVIHALKETVRGKEKQLALAAFEALTSLGAAEGMELPVVVEIPEMIKNSVDDAVMVLVPAGTFLFGSREDDKEANSNEKPQRVVELPSYYIDVFPVTNEQYCIFLNKIKPDKKSLNRFIKLEGSLLGEKCRIKKDGEKYQVESGYDKHPVIYVSWFGADAYAKWAGKRLPNEQEWEKAARGTDGRKYPWGEKFDKTLCNTAESKIGGTSEVDRFPGGKSPYGCYDMAGNVWEWTESWFDERETARVLRGGSWCDYRDDVRCAYRGRNFLDGRFIVIGFRCVRTIK